MDFQLRLSVDSVFASTLQLVCWLLSRVLQLKAEPDLPTFLSLCNRPLIHLLYSLRPMLLLNVAVKPKVSKLRTAAISHSNYLKITAVIKMTTY